MEQALLYRVQLRRTKLDELVQSIKDTLKSSVVADNWLIESKIGLKLLLEKFDIEVKEYMTKSAEPDQNLLRECVEFQLKTEETLISLETMSQVHVSKRTHNQVMQTRLPKLEIPKFDGKVTKWTEFWDRFEEDVHNKDLPDVDKLSYLMTCLQGQAFETLEGIGKTNLNYDVAVNLLKSRYGSKRLVVDAHYKAFYDLPMAKPTALECRRTLNSIEKHLRVLQSLGESDEGSHLRIAILNKFPPDITYQVNLRVGLEPTVKSIRDTLDMIVTAMENSTPSTSKTEPIPTATSEVLHVRTKARDTAKRRMRSPKGQKEKRTRHDTCAFCNGGHYSDRCQVHKSIKERRSRLKDKCYLCFKPGHSQRTCRANIICAHCGFKHNRALCFKTIKTKNSVQKKDSQKDKGDTDNTDSSAEGEHEPTSSLKKEASCHNVN